jgi:hypothetical protein
MLAPEVGLRQPSAILHRATAGGVYGAFLHNHELGRGLRDDIDQRKLLLANGKEIAMLRKEAINGGHEKDLCWKLFRSCEGG